MRFPLILLLANLSVYLNTQAQGPGNLTGQNLNYQVKNTIKVRGIISEASIPSSSSQTSQTVIYMDDVGRPVQTVATQASPGLTDMIYVSKYDNLGRESEKLLEYTSAQSDGRFRAGALTEIYSFYANRFGDNNPLTKSIFTSSPLSRLVEQGGVGDAWQPNSSVPADGKTKKFFYGTNAASEILKWTINGTDDALTNDISSSYYPANTLAVSTVVDDANPDHVQTKIYKDFLGNTILQKQQVTSTQWAETYYVYDRFGRLRVVLPPQAVEIIKSQNITSITELPAGYELVTEDRSLTAYSGVSYLYMPGVTVTLPATYTWSPTFVVKPYDSNASLLGQYAFQYLYDDEGRKIAEKSPGSEWVYFVYDKSDQLVLRQDGNQRFRHEWTFYKYDPLGRPALTGLVTLTAPLDQIRTDVNNNTVTFENRGDVVLHYTNNAYPNVTDANAYLSATYYDDIKTVPEAYSDYQDPLNSGNLGSVLFEMNNTANNKGLTTHTKSRILGTQQWIETSYFYDKYHNNVYTSVKETKSDGGRYPRYSVERYYDYVYNRVDHEMVFANSDDEGMGMTRRYEYDNSGRVSKEYCSILKQGLQPEIMSASYVYDDLGQLVDKKVHSVDNGSTWLQSQDYQYNIQGALTALNNLTGTGGETDYLGFDIAFDNLIPGAGNTPRYDGLISGMRWKDDLSQKENLYNFSYDQMSRLTSSNYKKNVSGVWTAENRYSENNLSYDLNGNILSLNRYQGSGSNTVDELSYGYGTGGNQLRSVSDASPGGTAGFADGNSGEDYGYDANGNLLLDRNKYISSITYNHLNLPDEVILNPKGSITETTIKYIRYSYTEDGTKLSQTYSNVDDDELVKIQYLNEFVAVNGLFQSIRTPHGRIVAPAYSNLVSNREANSLEGFSTNGSVTLSTVFQNDETYVKAVCNQTTSTPGIWPIGGTISVKEGERYSFKILGYRETSESANLYVKGNTNDIVWTGELLPEGQANENYVTNEFIVPAEVSEISVGVLWSNPASGATFYINRVAVYKLDWEYQYFLADHLGSPRVVLGTNPSTLNYTGTFETENRATDDSTFLNLEYANVVPHTLANATPGGNEVIRLNNTYRIGPAKSFKVFPGDKIDASVYAYYDAVSQMTKTPVETMATALASAMSSAVTGIDGAITTAYTNSESAIPGFLLSTFQGSDKPSAFINYILFDASYNPIEAKSVPVGGTANTRLQILLPQIDVKELGYLFVYLSYDNESTSWVHFDEFKITYAESPVIQVNAYYPYGMLAYSWVRDGEEETRDKFQGKEYDSLTQWYDFEARQYDAALGRWFIGDPKGEVMPYISNYAAMMNSPLVYTDPDGNCPICIPIFIGALINTAIQEVSGNVNSASDFFLAAGIGGLAGAAGFGGGALVSNYVGTVGFAAGGLTGAAGGFAGGFVGGAGNAWMSGANFGQGLRSGLVGGGYGAFTGGTIGGVSGGISSVTHGGNFWSGKGAIFASYAGTDVTPGEPLDYSTNTAEHYAEKYYRNLKYYDKVHLTADGSFDSKVWGSEGDWFVQTTGKEVGQRAYAYTEYRGIGKGADIVFAKASFSSARQLYLTMGHEYIHAGFFLTQTPKYGWGSSEEQHGSIYRWEQEVSKRWGNWDPHTGTYMYKSFYRSEYDHKKFFNVVIPWID